MSTTLMGSSGTTSNDNEITEEGTTNNNDDEIPEEGTTTNNNENIKEGMKSTSNNNDMNEDHVTVFVAYNGNWEYDRKEWFFENSKSSIMVVPKRITLLEITDILHKQLKVNKEGYRLKLEVHYRTGSPWFPVTEIQNDQDLLVFISETSKTRLPLCVTRIHDDEISSDDDKISARIDEERQKDHVRLLVAYNGKWRWDGKKWLFENSKGSIMVVSKYVTMSQITGRLYRKYFVDQSSYYLKLEVHYRGGSPWFPVTEIQNNQDLSVFISESWKTKLPLCVTRVAKAVVIEGAEHGREDDSVEKRLIKAIRKNDWVKAREIVNTGEVTWTSKLNEEGVTALHFAVGPHNDNEVVRDIVMGINKELLVTTVDNYGGTPVHAAALYGDTEALKIMLDFNPNCLFTLDDDGDLPIHHTLITVEIKTFLYLFKQMKSYKVEYDKLFSGTPGINLLHKVIDKGIIDVAYELINDYPSLATTTYGNKTALECIIRKPELFYSGMHNYSFYSRFVYQIVPIENNSLGSNDMADVENQVTPKKDKFVTEHTRRSLHDGFVSNYGTPHCYKIPNVGDKNVTWKSMPLVSIRAMGVVFFMARHNDMAFSPCLATIPAPFVVPRHKGPRHADDEPKTPTKYLFVGPRSNIKLLNLVFFLFLDFSMPHIKHLKDDKVKHNTTIKLLRRICEEVDRTHTSSDIIRLYSSPFCLAVENNTNEAIDVLTTYFVPIFYSEKDGQDIYQLAVLNRSEKVYSAILHHFRNAKSIFSTFEDHDGNNILHLAGRLAPTHKLNAASGAALQMQRELQWFEELKKLVGITHTRALNKNKETPMMVFRSEHKELRKDGEEWMKKTADSYTITAALIITIVFAAAITVPGGNDSATGKPLYETKASLIIFAISDAISLFTATTSLLLFLSILTARYADEDFLYKLPKRLIYGLVMLFVSVTSMLIAFSAALYIMFGQGKEWILIPILH
ncbi:ankyrin repeat-containing domain, PGG domain, Gag-polypeptide of LTR copia-type [Artemisia annua]|uniref:Ankyrin repeat-containing domain, PGG domain, Gag-polypeptide of LTR copia-type n=1 Tax=Artemisia annua TaxID=35608 RepID=A0A2U1MXN6_ARTAN|nr:ankyrin repeat-containing domain, PGG domain, Gag-polypeptide of LTR copia-type [Artemisia annua]